MAIGGGAAGKVLPEYRVLFGLAQFVAGDDAVNMLIQSGPLKFQGQRIRMAVGDDDRAQSGLAECGQKVGYMGGAVANAVANFRLKAGDVQGKAFAPVIGAVPVQ